MCWAHSSKPAYGPICWSSFFPALKILCKPSWSSCRNSYFGALWTRDLSLHRLWSGSCGGRRPFSPCLYRPKFGECYCSQVGRSENLSLEIEFWTFCSGTERSSFCYLSDGCLSPPHGILDFPSSNEKCTLPLAGKVMWRIGWSLN